MTLRMPAAWLRVALVLFAVGWGANQFTTMLIVYRHALDLGAGEIAGLFAVYALTLIPGLLAGGPLSDRFGRRACVLPFAALSPVATLLLVLGPHSLPLILAGRALAGLCSGMVIGPATAWVQDLSGGGSRSSRRAALALSAGFGLGPVVTALLAQWAGDPLVVPYLPHLVLGVAALGVGLTVPGTAPARRPAGQRGRRVPAALRTPAFWRTVAPPAPFVFGAISLALVVLPEEVTSARTLSAGYAALMTALAFTAGIGVQPAARRLAERRPQAGVTAGLLAAAAGAAAGVAAVSGPSRVLAAAGAVFFGLAYGLCLVCGLHQAEELAGTADRGTVLGVYYVLAYLGFGAPYAVDGLNAVVGRAGAFALLAGLAVVLAVLTRPRHPQPSAAGSPAAAGEPAALGRGDTRDGPAAAVPRAEPTDSLGA